MNRDVLSHRCRPGSARREFRQPQAGGIRRRLLFALAIVAILIGLLPTLVAKTPLRNVLLSSVVPNGGLRVTAGDASLGWFSRPTLLSIDAKDPTGATLATLDAVRLDRPLWALLLNSRDLGTIELQRPTLYVTVRPDGSNLEDMLHPLLAKYSGTPAEGAAPAAPQPATELGLRVLEGVVLMQDATTGRRWRVHGINFECDSLGSGLDRLALSGQLADEGIQRTALGSPTSGDDPTAGRPGTAAGRFTLTLSPGEAARQQLGWQVEGLTLEAAAAWLGRIAPGSVVGGTLSSQGTAAWTAGGATAIPADLATSGTVQIDRFHADSPALAGDRLRLIRIELPWRVTAQQVGLVLEDVQLRSDLGQMAVRGVVDPAGLHGLDGLAAWNPTALDAAARHDLELRGSLDVARLATMLPRLLRIRDDTTLQSGTVEVTARHQPIASGQLVTGSVQAANLAATTGGRPFRWEQPVSARFAVRREQGSARLEALECNSEFLMVRAAGTPQQLDAAANFDLNRLAAELGQFIDLSGIELAGTGEATVAWQQRGQNEFTATARGKLAQLRVGLAEGRVWSEPQLEIHSEAAGSLDASSRQPAGVSSGLVRLAAQGDQLDARLTGPVDWSTAGAAWPVALRGSGNIARWLARLRPWLQIDPWQVDGHSELTADVRLAADRFEVAAANVTLHHLTATGNGWSIREPRVVLEGDGRWDGSTGELASATAQLVTSTFALAAKDVLYRPGGAASAVSAAAGLAPPAPAGQGPPPIAELRGVAAFRVDLARLAAWQASTDRNPPYQPRGMLSGNVRFAEQAGGLVGEVTADGEGLALAQWKTTAGASLASRTAAAGQARYEDIWQEPKLRVRGQARYEAAADRLAFEQLLIESETLQATADGHIAQLASTAEVNLNGTLDYDLAQLSPLLRPYLGEGIQFVGRERAEFALAGRLADGAAPAAAGASGTSVADPYRLASHSSGGSRAVHWSRRLVGRLDLPWSSANLYGLPVGPGRITATLSDGAIRVEPISLAVSEGRFTAAPRVRLDPPPVEMSLPAGPMITNVRISPEVSETMLKYVAPVLAGVTQSEGRFSMQLEGARVPLDDFERADAAGQMTVHSVRVVPGPIARDWIGIAQQVEALAKARDAAQLAQRPQVTLLSIRDQQINFRMLEGRVHHQQMEFQVDDIVMRTQGSVGFDQSLALMLQVPIQDRWIERERLLAGLRGQSLSIPVSGTLTRPQLDRSAVSGLSQQLLQSAAQEAVGSELNRALDKLFKPR